MKFIQFYTIYPGNQIKTMLGSDSYLPVDGRYSIQNILGIVQDHIAKHKKVTDLVLYTIQSGNIRQSTTIHVGYRLNRLLKQGYTLVVD